jgi:hypothetical protein
MEIYYFRANDRRARDSRHELRLDVECGPFTRIKDSLDRNDNATSPGSYLSWHLGVWRSALSVYAFLRYAFGGGCSILCLA